MRTTKNTGDVVWGLLKTSCNVSQFGYTVIKPKKYTSTEKQHSTLIGNENGFRRGAAERRAALHRGEAQRQARDMPSNTEKTRHHSTSIGDENGFRREAAERREYPHREKLNPSLGSIHARDMLLNTEETRQHSTFDAGGSKQRATEKGTEHRSTERRRTVQFRHGSGSQEPRNPMALQPGGRQDVEHQPEVFDLKDVQMQNWKIHLLNTQTPFYVAATKKIGDVNQTNLSNLRFRELLGGCLRVIGPYFGFYGELNTASDYENRALNFDINIDLWHLETWKNLFTALMTKKNTQDDKSTMLAFLASNKNRFLSFQIFLQKNRLYPMRLNNSQNMIYDPDYLNCHIEVLKWRKDFIHGLGIYRLDDNNRKRYVATRLNSEFTDKWENGMITLKAGIKLSDTFVINDSDFMAMETVEQETGHGWRGMPLKFNIDDKLYHLISATVATRDQGHFYAEIIKDSNIFVVDNSVKNRFDLEVQNRKIEQNYYWWKTNDASHLLPEEEQNRITHVPSLFFYSSIEAVVKDDSWKQMNKYTNKNNRCYLVATMFCLASLGICKPLNDLLKTNNKTTYDMYLDVIQNAVGGNCNFGDNGTAFEYLTGGLSYSHDDDRKDLAGTLRPF